MSNYAERQEARTRALRALYDLTVAQRQPGSALVPTPSLDEIMEYSGLTYDLTSEAMSYLVRCRFVEDEETGPTYSLTPEGEDEVEGMIENETISTSIADLNQVPLLIDPSLVTALLKFNAENARMGVRLPVPPIPGYSAELVAHHLKNMKAEGLIDGTTMSDGSWKLSPLPWAGQRVLEAAQKDTPLRRTLQKAGNAGGQMANTVFSAVVSRWLRGE